MSKSMLELRHLRTLLAVDEAGSLSKAAQVLHLTQSAVSHQIKALESFYGEELVYKQGGSSRFSATGQILLELARKIVPEIERAQVQIDQLHEGVGGPLRIAVECHTCFDWLMPSMDSYRNLWPEVDLDIVSGFHADPVGLVHRGDAELAIVSEPESEPNVHHFPLFAYEVMGVVPNDSPLAKRQFLRPSDFKNQTLITYPVPDDMLDVMKHFLLPANIKPHRRSSELTVALLQLVASRKGISALPLWAVVPYLSRQYVSAVPLGPKGLQAQLYAAVHKESAQKRYIVDFVEVMRKVSLSSLDGVTPLVLP